MDTKDTEARTGADRKLERVGGGLVGRNFDQTTGRGRRGIDLGASGAGVWKEMEASAFRVSEEGEAAGAGGTAVVWAWLRRHRRVVMWGVVLALGAEGLRELYEVARSWVAGDDAAVGRELKDVPIYFVAAWGVYRRPGVWGWRVGMLLVWVGAVVFGIGAPLVWWIWHEHLEEKSWWESVSMSGGDWLGVALHALGLLAFTAACLALRTLYAEEHAAGGGGIEK